ncbi:GreA/GreB family elongation factor [Weeksellaceae bacterium A-14]
MNKNIVLTTGIYDVIKDHLRRKRVSPDEEQRLTEELRNAKQVRRRELPDDVVTVNRKVVVKDHTSDQEQEYIFVSTTKAKPKKNKHSILSEMALATVGYRVGDIIRWPFREGERTIEILQVEPFEG